MREEGPWRQWTSESDRERGGVGRAAVALAGRRAAVSGVLARAFVASSSTSLSDAISRLGAVERDARGVVGTLQPLRRGGGGSSESDGAALATTDARCEGAALVTLVTLDARELAEADSSARTCRSLLRREHAEEASANASSGRAAERRGLGIGGEHRTARIRP